MGETIRDCPSFPGYAASDEGRIFSRWVRASGLGRNACTIVPTACRPLKLIRRADYRAVTISQRRRPVAVHVLVMDAFVGPRPTGMLIRHLDGDEQNNRPGNLAYGTPVENGADKRRLSEAARGERNGRARLTADQVLAIRRRSGSGESVAALARELGLGLSTVHAAATGQTWRWL